MSSRPKNQVSRAEAIRMQRNLHADSRMGWQQWEAAIDALFRCNRARWRWFHLPRLKTKKDNQRLPKDLPDFWGIGRLGTDREGWLVVIEAKTGSGVQTPGQRGMMAALLAVPGVRGGVFYPHDRAALVELLGDDVIG